MSIEHNVDHHGRHDIDLEQTAELIESEDEIVGKIFGRSLDEDDCPHEVVGENGECLCCPSEVPMSWMYDEYTHVVTNECFCDAERAFVSVLDTIGDVSRLECKHCGEVLSFKSMTATYHL